MKELRQYNQQKVVGSWAPAGVAVIDITDGSVSDEFFSTARNAPRWAHESDGMGNATRVKGNDRGASFTVTLSASSPTNEALTRAAEADDITETVVGPMLLRDLNGQTVITANNAYLEGIPDRAYQGNARGTVAWVFHCSDMTRHIGGHNQA